MTTSEVNAANQKLVWQRISPGRVRINEETAQKWKHGELELFTIPDAQPSDPHVTWYRIDPLDGSSYEWEVQKVSVPSVKLYLVETALQSLEVRERERAQVLVKWCGYSASFNN